MNLPGELANGEGDLLSLLRLQGGGFPGREDDARVVALQRRIQRRRDIELLLAQAGRAGWRAMVVFGAPPVTGALGRARSGSLPTALPVVPNLQGFMREAVEYGMVGAGVRRALRVGPIGLVGLGLRSVGRLPAILQRDFPTLLRCFIELELAEVARLRPPVVFLQAQMTDLALAMDNPRILQAFMEAVARRTGGAPGLISWNIVALEDALRRWGVRPAAVLTAWDAAGQVARPEAGSARDAIRALGVPVGGLRREWIEPPSEEERASAREAGLVGWIREDVAALGGPVREAAQ